MDSYFKALMAMFVAFILVIAAVVGVMAYGAASYYRHIKAEEVMTKQCKRNEACIGLTLTTRPLTGEGKEVKYLFLYPAKEFLALDSEDREHLVTKATRAILISDMVVTTDVTTSELK